MNFLKSKEKKPFDFSFFLIVLGLLAFGLVMVFSASSEAARVTYDDAFYFIKRQMLWAVISIIAMLITSKIHYKKLAKYAGPIMIITIILLVLVLIIGSDVNGGKRWLDFKIMSFQPSEAAKIALILFFGNALSKNKDALKHFTSGLLPYLFMIGVIAALLMLEPHMSGTVVIVLIGVVMLYVAGAKTSHLTMVIAPAIVGAIGLIFTSEYRMQRVTSFMDPFKDKLGDGWQSIQSLYAIGSGGLFGLGLGRSRQKFLYIPEPHNDFIFAILCEELGLIGALVAILLFVLLIYKGITIALNAPDTFSCLVATGITTLVAVEVIINIAVVTSSMPVTGMPLPFFSYGGTALLMHMIAMGIMLNISRYADKKG